MHWGQFAQRCWDQGWRGLIPLIRGSKQPAIRDWSSLSRERQTSLPKAHPASGVGLVVGHRLIAVDVDCDDPDTSKELISALPPTPAQRVGRAPRVMLLYRGDLSRDYRWPHRLPVEILALQGQVVLYGLHPKTKRDYTWPTGWEPASAAPWSLPELEERHVHKLCSLRPAQAAQVDSLVRAALARAAKVGIPDNDLELYAEALATQPPGGRHLLAVRLMMRLVHQGCPVDVASQALQAAWQRAFEGQLSEGMPEWQRLQQWVLRTNSRSS